jgi:hypothetical protein
VATGHEVKPLEHTVEIAGRSGKEAVDVDLYDSYKGVSTNGRGPTTTRACSPCALAGMLDASSSTAATAAPFVNAFMMTSPPTLD